MNEVIYLVLGTSSMVLMMLTIIVFINLYHRKLALKAKEYKEIEVLVHKQELQSAYFLIEGQEQERKRIAAELHDNIGGLLATLKIYSDLAVNQTKASEMRRLNNKINLIAENLSDEVRKLSHELDLRTLSAFGLNVAVQQLAEALTESGKLFVTAIVEVHKPIKDNISLHLYRIIQELFTNTLKHAMATNVRIEIALIGDDITLIYEDNGKGFDVNQVGNGGMGIQNINSRVRHIEGKLTVDSSSLGTTYILELINHE